MLLGFILAVAILPGVLDPTTSLRWAVLAVGVPIYLFRAREIDGEQVAMMAAGLVLISISLAWSPDPLNGLDDAAHLAILLAAFALGASTFPIERVWVGLAAGISVSAIIALAQLSAPLGLIPQTTPLPSGLFVNKNLLAEAALVALIPMLLSRRWLLAAGPVVAILLAESRAVFGAAALLGAVYLWYHRRERTAVILLAVIASSILFFFSDSNPSASSSLRLAFWSGAVSDLTWFGHGLGAFAVQHPWEEYVHSEPLQLLYEAGVLAVPAIAGAFYLVRRYDESAEYSIMLALLGISLLSFPLHQPLTAFAFFLVAGRVAATRAAIRDRDFARAVARCFAERDHDPDPLARGGRENRSSGSRLPTRAACETTPRRAYRAL